MNDHQTHADHAGEQAQFAVREFPQPGQLVQLAYAELSRLRNGDPDDGKLARTNPLLLPRPWMVESCRDPMLRKQLWEWLDRVVIWLNAEYAWQASMIIPGCWPAHPHLVHEIAVLADQRRRAGLSLGGNELEEWHRYCLPAFYSRTQERLRNGCEREHDEWPAQPQFTLAQTGQQHQVGNSRIQQDVAALVAAAETPAPAWLAQSPQLSVINGSGPEPRVDPRTGELLDEP